jgi:hypothetical protein
MLELSTARCLDALGVPYIKNQINGFGADFSVKGSILIEAKNLSGQYDITPFILKTSILERFTVLDPDHTKEWILVISKLKCSQEVMALFDLNSISVIQLGRQILTQNQDTQKIERLLRRQLARVFSILIVRASRSKTNATSVDDSTHLNDTENDENDGIDLIMPFLSPIFIDLRSEESPDFFDLNLAGEGEANEAV